MLNLRLSRSREPIRPPLDSGDVVPMVVRWRPAGRILCPCGARTALAIEGRKAAVVCAAGHRFRATLPDAGGIDAPDFCDLALRALDTSAAAA